MAVVVADVVVVAGVVDVVVGVVVVVVDGSEEHTSELQSHVRISYAVFCLKKKKRNIPLRFTFYFMTRYSCAHPIPTHTSLSH